MSGEPSRMVSRTDLGLKKINSILRIRPNDDLEVFSRRAYPRVDLTSTALVLRGVGSLTACRKHWNAATRALAAGKGIPPNLTPRQMKINLSAGGLALPLAPPVREAELCLVYLALDTGKLALWTGCEVAWTQTANDGVQANGLRFVAIMANDRTRLNDYVCGELRRQGRDVDQPVRPEQLVAIDRAPKNLKIDRITVNNLDGAHAASDGAARRRLRSARRPIRRPGPDSWNSTRCPSADCRRSAIHAESG